MIIYDYIQLYTYIGGLHEYLYEYLYEYQLLQEKVRVRKLNSSPNK